MTAKRQTFLLTASLAIVLAALPAWAEVTVFPSKSKKVYNYKTYEWLPTRIMTSAGIVEDDEKVSPHVREHVKKWLAKKGYQEVSEGGELHVLTAGLSEASTQLQGFLLGFGFDYFWGPYVTTVAPIQRVNREGTLVVGLLDAKTNEGVWVGFATEAIGARINKTVEKAAGKLLKKLPSSKRP